MSNQTTRTIEAVLDSSTDITPEVKSRIMALLKGKQPRSPMVTRKEACQTLGVCTATLRRYELRGILNPVRLSKRNIVYRASDIDSITGAEGVAA